MLVANTSHGMPGAMQALPRPVDWRKLEISDNLYEWADFHEHIKWMLEQNGPQETVWQNMPNRADRFWLDVEYTVEVWVRILLACFSMRL